MLVQISNCVQLLVLTYIEFMFYREFLFVFIYLFIYYYCIVFLMDHFLL